MPIKIIYTWIVRFIAGEMELRMNNISLMGNMVTTPKLTMTKNGPRCFFRIAVDRMVRSKGTDYFDIVAWGNVANAVHKHIKKGEMVGVVGHARMDIFRGRNGGEYASFRVDASYVVFTGGGKGKDADDVVPLEGVASKEGVTDTQEDVDTEDVISE